MRFNKAELKLIEDGLGHLWWYYRKLPQDQVNSAKLIKIEHILAKIAP